MSETIRVNRYSGGLRLVTQGRSDVAHALPDLGEEPGRGAGSSLAPSAETPPATGTEKGERLLEREFLRGLHQGREEARRQLEKEWIRERELKESAAAGVREAIQEQMGRFMEGLEHEAYRFALAVAGLIVRREVSMESDLVVRQVREAIRRIVGVESVILRVHPDDEPAVRGERQTLLASADSLRELIVEPDEKVERGGCIIESPSGTIDARVSTALRQIEIALFGPPGEPAGGDA